MSACAGITAFSSIKKLTFSGDPNQSLMFIGAGGVGMMGLQLFKYGRISTGSVAAGHRLTRTDNLHGTKMGGPATGGCTPTIPARPLWTSTRPSSTWYACKGFANRQSESRRRGPSLYPSERHFIG